MGISWGDPHAIGEDGDDFTYGCQIGSFTNVFSDYGIQINGLCDSYGAAFVFSDVALVVGGHYIYVNSGYVASAQDGAFLGVVQVDGVTTAPAAAGTYTVLNDAQQNIMMQVVYGAPGAPDSGANYVLLTTPEYVVSMSWVNSGSLDMQVQATNAGACGTPGGVLGQTFGAVANVDTNGLDFTAPSQWYLAPQYSASCATAAKASMVGHATLTQ